MAFLNVKIASKITRTMSLSFKLIYIFFFALFLVAVSVQFSVIFVSS